MANELRLTNATLEMNGVVRSYVPGSITFTKGWAEYKVEALSNGGDNVEVVVSEDITTKKSDFKVSLPSTTANINLIDEFKNAFPDGITILLYKDDFSVAYSNMILTNKPDVPISSDDSIEMEFEGKSL